MIGQTFLPYAHQSIDAQDLEAVQRALQGDFITRGPEVEAFEKEFAEFCGSKYAVAFNTGSAALSGAYYAAGTGPIDRIVSTPNTFIATVGSGVQFGATPVFVDIDTCTGSVNLEQLALTANIAVSRGKPIVVPVHFAGPAIDMQKLDSMLANPEIVVIEDASHAIGSFYPNNGPRVGSCEWSHMTIFSLHPAKTMTTGEGGVVTTNQEEYFHRLTLFRNNCIERDPRFMKEAPAPWFYEVVDLSNNYNFTEFQAALGRSQLKRIESFITKRRELMKAYREKLRDFRSLTLLSSDQDDQTAFHLCVVQIDYKAYGTTRTGVMNKLKDSGIGSQVHYIPLYRHPCFAKKFGDIASYFPKTEDYYEKALSIPLYYDLTLEDVDRVVAKLKEVLS